MNFQENKLFREYQHFFKYFDPKKHFISNDDANNFVES